MCETMERLRAEAGEKLREATEYLDMVERIAALQAQLEFGGFVVSVTADCLGVTLTVDLSTAGALAAAARNDIPPQTALPSAAAEPPAPRQAPTFPSDPVTTEAADPADQTEGASAGAAPAAREGRQAPAPAAGAKAPAKKGGRLAKKWDEVKERQLVGLRDGGWSWDEIGRAIGVTKKAAEVHFYQMRARGRLEQVRAAAVPDVRAAKNAAASTAAEPGESAPAPQATPVTPGAEDVLPETNPVATLNAPALPPLDRRQPRWVQALMGEDYLVGTHLARLPPDDLFSAEMDVTMAEMLARGDGAAAAAEALGCSKPAVIARWRELNTNPTSLDHQTRLLRLLKLRARQAERMAAE